MIFFFFAYLYPYHKGLFFSLFQSSFSFSPYIYIYIYINYNLSVDLFFSSSSLHRLLKEDTSAQISTYLSLLWRRFTLFSLCKISSLQQEIEFKKKFWRSAFLRSFFFFKTSLAFLFVSFLCVSTATYIVSSVTDNFLFFKWVCTRSSADLFCITAKER